MKKELANY